MDVKAERHRIDRVFQDVMEEGFRKNDPLRKKGGDVSIEDRFKRTDTELVDEIQRIRTANNQHWMDLMRLALKAEPDKAKAILRDIEECDGEVRRLMKELANS